MYCMLKIFLCAKVRVLYKKFILNYNFICVLYLLKCFRAVAKISIPIFFFYIEIVHMNKFIFKLN